MLAPPTVGGVGAGAGAAVDGAGAGALGATVAVVVLERALDWLLDGELDCEPEPHAAAPASSNVHASVNPRRREPVRSRRAGVLSGVLSMPKPSMGTVRALWVECQGSVNSRSGLLRDRRDQDQNSSELWRS